MRHRALSAVSADETGPPPKAGQNVRMTESQPGDVAERLRRRYPRSRMPKPVLIGLVAVGTAIALSWLVWTAWVHANPAVAAQVSAYTVQSNATVAVTLTVDRRDPAVPASCRVVAQAEDFQPVGEQLVKVPASAYKVVNVTFSLTTFRRATTASAKDCTSGG
jgi:Domain of unknown function (DUF4307)